MEIVQMELIRDAQLVTVHYGGFNELRKDASMRAIVEWDRQSAVPERSFLLELVCPGDSPQFCQTELPGWLKYVRIYGGERNRNLFQKEAMWNIGAKLADSGRILFVDGDCMPVDCPDWFVRLFEACVPGRCVHAAWHLIHEGQDTSCGEYWSWFSGDPELKGRRRFPGLGYCLCRSDFDARDGFNAFGITGSGDAIFIWESLPSLDQKFIMAKRYHMGLVRHGLPALEPFAVSGMTVQHNFHGQKTDRGYVWSRCAVELFGDPRSYCHIDPAGLVAWNDPEFILKDIAMEKKRMHTRDELYELVCEVVSRRLDVIEARNNDNGYRYDQTEFNKLI